VTPVLWAVWVLASIVVLLLIVVLYQRFALREARATVREKTRFISMQQEELVHLDRKVKERGRELKKYTHRVEASNLDAKAKPTQPRFAYAPIGPSHTRAAETEPSPTTVMMATAMMHDSHTASDPCPSPSYDSSSYDSGGSDSGSCGGGGD